MDWMKSYLLLAVVVFTSAPDVSQAKDEGGFHSPADYRAAGPTGFIHIEATVEVAKRNELHTFAVIPKRWVVERSISWPVPCKESGCQVVKNPMIPTKRGKQSTIVTRRGFGSLLSAAGLAIATGPFFAKGKKPLNLRVIAYNFYVGRGWPKERRAAKAAVAHGQMARRLAMELAIHEPDIITFSETPSEKIVREIAGHLRMNHVWFPSGGNWPGALLSRFEIVDAENTPLGGERPADLFTRHWGKGRIRLPGGEELVVHSAHLYPGPDPAVRLREIPVMLAAMKSDLGIGRPMLLMGDLNHTPETEEYRLWLDAGWIDTFAASGKGQGFTVKADVPERRIDYVMAAGSIAKQIVESRPLFEGAFRLSPADSEAFALSDHLPQYAEFHLEG